MTGGNKDDAMVSVLRELRKNLPPKERAEMDATLQEQARASMQRYQRMQKAVAALDVLHGDGDGERAGFCTECGSVAPCQTRKFITPFLTP